MRVVYACTCTSILVSPRGLVTLFARMGHDVVIRTRYRPITPCLIGLETMSFEIIFSYYKLVWYNYVCHCVLYILQQPFGTPIQILIQYLEKLCICRHHRVTVVWDYMNLNSQNQL